MNPDLCKDPCNNATSIINSIKTFLNKNKMYAVCNSKDVETGCLAAKNIFSDYTSAELGGTCDELDTNDLDDIDAPLGNFFAAAFGNDYQERFIWRVETDTEISTYYKPTEPYLADGSRCAGGPSNTGESLAVDACKIFNHEPMGNSDLRHQFLSLPRTGSPWRRLCWPCLPRSVWLYALIVIHMIKPLITDEEFVDPPAYSCFKNEGGFTDQDRYMTGIINYRAGERVGFPKGLIRLVFWSKEIGQPLFLYL